MSNTFDLHDALYGNHTNTRPSIMLRDVAAVNSIYKSKSTSTEQFCSNAINDLASVESNVMYVNMMLRGLDDRLNLARKLAVSVESQKRRGVEAFVNRPSINPWKYAVEGKVKDFFKRIWEAIKAACRRIIVAIANFIKWLGNVIQSAAVKGQIKDFKEYKKNKAQYDKYGKAAGVGKITFNSLEWKVNANEIGNMCKKAAAHYIKTTQKGEDSNLLERVSKVDLQRLTTADDFAKAYKTIFGMEGGSGIVGVAKGAMRSLGMGARDKVKRITARLNEDMEAGVKSVFGKPVGDSRKPKDIVMGSIATASGKVQKISVEKMRKLSSDFECLSEAWLAKNVTEQIAAVNKAQSEFTAFTKNVDRVAARFDKVTDSKDGVATLSSLTAELANARIRYNGFYTGIMLELESAALRFRKSAHIALKQYLKGSVTPKQGKKTKTTESYTYGGFYF